MSSLHSAAFLLLCTSILPAQAILVQTIPAADLQADVAILRQAYQQLHPGLYRYNTHAQMDAHFDALQSQLNHSQSLQDAYLALSIFTAQIRCGHTYPNFFNQPKAIAAAVLQSQPRVPFLFVWIDREMVVTRDLTPNHQLPRGTRVLALNGNSSRAILARLMTIARADGSNDAKRIAYLGLLGDSNYEAFDIYLPLFFPGNRLSAASPIFILRVQLPGTAKPARLRVGALTYTQRAALVATDENSGKDDALFTWSTLPDGSAYVRMATWAVYNSRWDWKSWLNQHLDQLADSHAPNLIIDLRGNEGGNEVGNVILARLIQHDLRLSTLRRLTRYRRIPDDLAPYLDTWDPSFKDWKQAATPITTPLPSTPAGVDYFSLAHDDDSPDGDIIHPAARPFTGQVAVLVDANNSSATFQFAQVIQQNHLGLLVGAPTGGNQRGINGGAFFFLRLPHSHLEVDLPLIATFPLTLQPDAGLTPDILSTSTAQHIANNTDSILAAALSALKHRTN